MAKLSIEIPPELFSALEEAAREAGVTPEVLVSEWVIPWLAAVIERREHDPLVKLFGSIQSDLPNWTERHDEFLGQQFASRFSDALQFGEEREAPNRTRGLTF